MNHWQMTNMRQLLHYAWVDISSTTWRRLSFWYQKAVWRLGYELLSESCHPWDGHQQAPCKHGRAKWGDVLKADDVKCHFSIYMQQRCWWGYIQLARRGWGGSGTGMQLPMIPNRNLELFPLPEHTKSTNQLPQVNTRQILLCYVMLLCTYTALYLYVMLLYYLHSVLI